MLSHYDRDKDNKLSFQEFLPIMLSVDDSELRFKTVQREIYRVTLKERLLPEIEKLLVQVLLKEINLIMNAEHNKLDLSTRKDFNCLEVFKAIDLAHKKFIDVESLLAYLRKNRANIETEEVVAFIRRFDFDKDCMLSLFEFMNGITLIERKEKVHGRNTIERNYIMTSQERLSTPAKSKAKYSRNKPNESKKIFYSEQKHTPTQQIVKSPLKSILKSNTDKKSPPKNHSQVVMILKKQAQDEYIIESLKQSIATTKDVSLKVLYDIFDSGNKGYILFKDFAEAFHRFHLNPTNDELNMVFNSFDRDMNEKLSYEDIYSMFIPQQKEHAEILLSKDIPIHSISIKSCELIKQLLQQYLATRHKHDINLQEVFKECDSNKKGFITKDDIKKYLKVNGVDVNDVELQLLVNKYDYDGDGKITFAKVKFNTHFSLYKVLYTNNSQFTFFRYRSGCTIN